jgi:hypothetical protein
MRRLVCMVMAAGSWTLSCRAASTPSDSTGYWSVSCVSGDGRYLLAGGDHAALVDSATGNVLERAAGMVKALGCDHSGGIVVGNGSAMRLPGRTSVSVPAIGGDSVLGVDPSGTWISSARTISGGRWRGPASIFVSGGEGGNKTDLLPARFGSVGTARTLPTPDSFAVRFGNLLEGGRVLLAAGWEPSRSGGNVESLPWGFFAWDSKTGDTSPLAAPLPSDAAINQAWFQRIAGTRDAARMVAAVHDGKRVSIGWFERGAQRATRVVTLDAHGGPSALALSDDGAFVAVATESRGREAPARAWILDAEGKTVWSGSFAKNVAGLHFLADGSVLVAAGEAKAVKVPLP